LKVYTLVIRSYFGEQVDVYTDYQSAKKYVTKFMNKNSKTLDFNSPGVGSWRGKDKKNNTYNDVCIFIKQKKVLGGVTANQP
jgi:hypothetical protein